LTRKIKKKREGLTAKQGNLPERSSAMQSTPSVVKGSRKEGKVKGNPRIRFPGQEFTEEELLSMRDRKEDLAVKGPFQIFRVKRDRGKIVPDSKERTEEDHWFPDALESFYEGSLNFGRDNRIESALIIAFSPEYLTTEELEKIGNWTGTYVRAAYARLLRSQIQKFPVRITYVTEAVLV